MEEDISYSTGRFVLLVKNYFELMLHPAFTNPAVPLPKNPDILVALLNQMHSVEHEHLLYRKLLVVRA